LPKHLHPHTSNIVSFSVSLDIRKAIGRSMETSFQKLVLVTPHEQLEHVNLSLLSQLVIHSPLVGYTMCDILRLNTQAIFYFELQYLTK
jgi:hypothetical protein